MDTAAVPSVREEAREGLTPIVDEGLGNSTYLLDLGDGRALVVDPPRDLRRVRSVADRVGVTIAFAADTHLHADFLTGAVQLAATDGATVLASAAGHREYPHRPLHDGDEVDLGGLRLQTLATPGHTVEHVSFLIRDGARPVGVFTGGSLIVGSAARTDLAGDEHTLELTRAQFASMRRLLTLPDDVAVWPTHGVGSFCSAPPGAERTSTIGLERRTNPLARVTDEAEFIRRLLDSLGSYPPYFQRLGEINRRGPAILTDPQLTGLSVPELERLLADAAQLVDVRPVSHYAAGHIPGALSIPLRDAFASWLGWLTDAARSLVFVRDPDQDAQEIIWQTHNIGCDDLAGELAGGMAAWRAAGRETAVTQLVLPGGVAGRPVLDVRQAAEFSTGRVPGSQHVELGVLANHTAEVPDGPLVVMCGHGERAAGAASILERAGRRDVAVLVGGPEDWAAASGRPLETS